METSLRLHARRAASTLLQMRAPLFPTLLLAGCGSFGLESPYPTSDGPSGDTAIDADTDTDVDADTDADADADTDTDSDTDTDTDADADLIEVTSVSPTYGTTAGGTSVTIRGGPFDSSASVRFGGVSATVESVNRNELRVRSPAQTNEGLVDVSIVTDTGSGALTSGFTYWQDGSGLAGMIGEFGWYDYVGGYWSSGADSGSGWFLPVVPFAFDHWELYAPSLDQCALDYSYGGSFSYYDLGVSSWNLMLPSSGSIPFTWDPAVQWFYNDTFSNTKYIQNGSYSLPAVSAVDMPELEVPDAVYAPSSFTVTSPSINSTAPPTFTRGNITLGWSGATGDFMLAILQVASGTTVKETVSCALRDDGSFTVPGSTFSRWATGDTLYVLVGRARYASGTVTFNNADSRIAGVYWVVGAGTLR
jgi:hypothetical protein